MTITDWLSVIAICAVSAVLFPIVWRKIRP